MAITGTGTQEDPFIVHTALELRTALGEANAYVKLDNDIDCNYDCRRWEQLTVLATDLHLNEHNLLNINCRGGYVFYIPTNSMHLFTIHDGWINNTILSGASFINDNYPNSVTYTANSKTGNYGTVIKDCAIFAKVDEMYNTANGRFLWGRGTRFYNTVWKGKVHSASTSAYIGYNAPIYNEGFLFEESRMVIQIDMIPSTNPHHNPMSINGHFISSQLDVTSSNIQTTVSYALGNESSINNCTINIKPVDGGRYSYTSLVYGEANSIGINVYNSDYINLTSQATYITQTQKPLTSSAMINSDANNGAGFSNIKVEL